MSRLIDADKLDKAFDLIPIMGMKEDCGYVAMLVSLGHVLRIIDRQPTVEPERDIPVKPNETTDTAWGIPHRQAVCPKCDYYLGHVVFLGDGKGKKVTYCETCGQAIDWEGWDSDE